MEKTLISSEAFSLLEQTYFAKIQTAAQSKDINKISKLMSVGEQLNTLKNSIREVNDQYSQITQLLEEKDSCFDIKITSGMLNQMYLTLKPINKSLVTETIIPSENIKFKVTFPEPMGTITTSYIKKSNWLQDRGKINTFFNTFGLQPGDIITFKQIEHNAEYAIEIKEKRADVTIK
ncbi:hypothetical protein [Paenibacillus sp. FSL R5-0914]|uniref:hypothetical protein n=1 Tax=Paenibacillus sp. FSL R5-0914 TaxID=2921665 RepID=UPI0030FBD4C4